MANNKPGAPQRFSGDSILDTDLDDIDFVRVSREDTLLHVHVNRCIIVTIALNSKVDTLCTYNTVYM